MHKRYITISAGALLLAATSPAMSHHPSGTGTSSTGGPIVTIPGTTLQKGASALYFVFEHISFDELSDAVLEAAAEKDQHAHSLATLESPALGYSYGLTDRLMVSVQLPYVVRTGIREASHHHHDEAAEEHSHAEGGATEEHEHESGEEHEEESETVDRGDTDGIGDLTLFGQYRFYGQDTGLQASLLTGLKTSDRKDRRARRSGRVVRSGVSARLGLLGSHALASPCRGLRAGGRSTATSSTRSPRKGRSTPISATASITMAR